VERSSLCDSAGPWLRHGRCRRRRDRPACAVGDLDDRDWEEARRRLELVGPLIDGTTCPRAVVLERARAANCDVTTLYRWAKLHRASGLLSSLLRRKPPGGRGKSRLPPPVEQILLQTIEEHYLTRQQRTIRSTAREVSRRCAEEQLRAPNVSTVREPMLAPPVHERLKRRSHRKDALDRFAPRPGTFGDAQRPLDVVQIDHTKLDIIVVDREQRLPFGRPWITLAIDVYSRMVVGFCISLDPPGVMSTGLCIAHAVLPKEAWLTHRGIAGSRPCWGFPARIHLDNAKDFHGEMLWSACEQSRIALDYRPPATPHMGGHIERLVGTLVRAAHELPGATFTNPKQRGNYNSEAAAILTLDELERWLSEYIVCVYHTRRHRELARHRCSAGPRASSATSSMSDAAHLIVRPTRSGFDWISSHSWSARINPTASRLTAFSITATCCGVFIGATSDGQKRHFVFRRDPRDISVVHFRDPELCRYSRIPYRNTTNPPMSV